MQYHCPPSWRPIDRFPAARAGKTDERGFSLVETMVALVVIVSVLLGLLASLDSGVRGILTGRQRSGGAALAKEVVEGARAVDFDDVGHDMSDATLATDPAVGGTAPDWTYTPEGGTAEDLVSAASPLYPVHQWDDTRDATAYTVKVYVTEVAPSTGDPLKRLTVAVSWGRAQYDPTVVENVIRVSSYLSELAPPGTLATTTGLVDVDGGVVSVTGELSGVDLTEGQLFLPYAHGEVDGLLVDTTRGYAGSARGSLDLGSGSPTGCTAEGTNAECAGTKAETLADNDAGTAPPLQDASGLLTSSGGTLAAGSALTMEIGDTTGIESKSSAESCVTCSPSIGDGDRLPYAWDEAAGAESMSMGFEAGTVSGSLVEVGSGGESNGTIDADAVTGGRKVVSTGTLEVPTLDILQVGGGPAGFTSAVSVSAVTAEVDAQAGPTALSPSVSGSSVTVSVYDTLVPGSPEYRAITFSPGDTVSDTAEVAFDVGGQTVSLVTTVEAGSGITDSTTDGSGTVTDASAELANWLRITVQFTVTAGGSTLADLLIDVDYGRLAARAGYEAT